MNALLTRQEAAKRLKISVRQFDRLVLGDGLPVIRIGACVRIREIDLEAWVEQRVTPSPTKL